MLPNSQFLKYIQPALNRKYLPKGKMLFKSLLDKIFNKKHLIKVQSFSHKNIYYEINLKSLTCSCFSFLVNHSMYSINDPRRLCKHLIKIFSEKNSLPSYLNFYKSEIQLLAEKGTSFYPCKHRINALINNKKLEVFAGDYDDFEDSPWVTVFYDEKRYLYNFRNKCWSNYQDGCPEDAEQIVEWINRHIDNFLPKSIPDYFNKRIIKD